MGLANLKNQTKLVWPLCCHGGALAGASKSKSICKVFSHVLVACYGMSANIFFEDNPPFPP